MNSVCAAIISSIVALATVIQVIPMALVQPLLFAKPTSRSEIKSKGGTDGSTSQGVFLAVRESKFLVWCIGISGLYADTFMFGGPNGVQAVKKEDFLKVIPKMKTHFSSMGLSETQLQAVEANPLDSKYLLAKVVWRMSLWNSSRSKHVDMSATYVLVQGNGDALSIVFQIDHQDLASVIKEQQNTQQ
jgi:hypothetical protein